MNRTEKSWPDELLDAARREGDPEVDQLVEQVLGPKETFSGVGRLGYNRLLNIADILLEAPELSFVESSQVRQQLDAFPPQLVNYFDPMEAPDWVDEAKLALAGRVWAENTLGVLSVLYAASLPYCYLIAKGIPSLYKTKKLLEQKYIYQRLYETGLMLDSVLGIGGLKIISDLNDGPHQRREHLRRRYVWGKGFISAKKVRFLHASMRFMLTHPKRFPPRGDIESPAALSERLSQETEPWPKDELGLPVNQEDLAYTLLTFGYIIPIGLERWGCKLALKEKEAFLHAWRLVGHIMGIKADLLPDNWEEAERLFEIIQRRQAVASQPGKELTEALMRFLEDYLPPLLRMNRSLPAILIMDQLGKEAAKIINEERMQLAEGRFISTAYRAARVMVWFYFFIRNRLFRRFPTAAGFMGEVFHQAGEAFIDSWRDAYNCRAFHVPAGAEGSWKRVYGVDAGFLKKLASWRRALFNNLAWSVASLVAAATALLLSALLYLLMMYQAASIVGWLSLGALLLGLASLKFGVPAAVRRRPQLSSFKGVSAEAGAPSEVKY
jgi:hypothetical protein